MRKMSMSKQGKQLYSLEQFIDTVRGLPKYKKLSDVTFAGFIDTMKRKDMQYVFEPHKYLEELEKYIQK